MHGVASSIVAAKHQQPPQSPILAHREAVHLSVTLPLKIFEINNTRYSTAPMYTSCTVNFARQALQEASGIVLLPTLSTRGFHSQARGFLGQARPSWPLNRSFDKDAPHAVEGPPRYISQRHLINSLESSCAFSIHLNHPWEWWPWARRHINPPRPGPTDAELAGPCMGERPFLFIYLSVCVLCVTILRKSNPLTPETPLR